MAELDIGRILFVEILKMTEYPGGIFSNHTIMENLVLYFLVPTVFIIIFLYVTVGRFFPHQKIRLVLSITIYLFIIVSGFYAGFAYFAGPYVIFLIVIGGILFLYSHFGMKQQGGGGNTSQLTETALVGNNEELINEYESLVKAYNDAKKVLSDLELKSAKTPGAYDRELQTQRDTVNHIARDLNRVQMQLEKRRIGHGFNTRMKNIRHDLGF